MTRRKRARSVAIIMAFAVLLSGCAGTGDTAVTTEASTAGLTESPPSRAERCLLISDIQNWRVVDNRQVVVYGRRRDEVWHLRFFSSCMDLSFAETVAFRARGSTLLCGDPGDEVITRGGRCPIASLRRIDAAGLAELLDPNVRKDIGKLPPRDTAPQENRQEKQ